MYKVESVLVYNGKVLGLRLRKQILETSWLQDIDISLFKGLKKEHLNPYPVEQLVDHEGLLVTQRELKWEFRVKDVSEDKEEVSRIVRLLLTPTDPELLEKVGKEVFDEILHYPEVGAYVVNYHSDGLVTFGNPSVTQYHKSAQLKTRVKLSWNEDHDYCERHYDAFGVIDDCPIFNKWEEYGKQVIAKYTKKYPVGVNFELRGVKYVLTLDVEVQSDCIL